MKNTNKQKNTYTLSRGSTGSSTTGLSAGSSLSFLTRGARKSLKSSWALEEKEIRPLYSLKTHKDGFSFFFLSMWFQTYRLTLGTGLSLRTWRTRLTLMVEKLISLFCGIISDFSDTDGRRRGPLTLLPLGPGAPAPP